MNRSLPVISAVLAAALWAAAGCSKSAPPEKPKATRLTASQPATAPASQPGAGTQPGATSHPAASSRPASGPTSRPVPVTVTPTGRPDGPSDAAFLADLKALTGSHRLAGFARTKTITEELGGELIDHQVVADEGEEDPGPGSRAAGKYVLGVLEQINRRLQAAGGKGLEIYTQEFPVVAPVYTQCQLYVDGKLIEGQGGREALYPMRHNLLQASITPEEGLEGELVYAGSGTAAEYGRNNPKDKIVLLNADCGQRWLDAFAFGARAVVFIGQTDPTPLTNTFHHVNVPANLPRFYVTAEVANKVLLPIVAAKPAAIAASAPAPASGPALTSAPASRPASAPAPVVASAPARTPHRVKLLAACRWERLRARNVVAVLRGTAPDFTKTREAIVLAAPLDALCDVPALSVGARDAANVAALLQLAERLGSNRPMRDLIFCFFDAQAANHQGARNFYAELFRRYNNLGKKTHDERIAELNKEWTFLDAAIAIFDQDELFTSSAKDAKYAGKAWTRMGPFAPALREGSDAALLAHHRAYAANNRMGEFSEAYEQAIPMLSNEAVRFDGDALTELRPARVELKKAVDALQDLRKKLADSAASAPEASDLRRRIAQAEDDVRTLGPRVERLRTMDLLWNCIQRVIHAKNGASTPQQLADIEDFAQKAVVYSKVAKGSEQDLEGMKSRIAATDIDDAVAMEKLFRDLGHTDDEAAENPTMRRSDRESLLRQLQLAILKEHVPRKFRWLVGYARALCRDRRTVIQGELVPWTEANRALHKAIGADTNNIVLHLSVNLGDARRRWTFIHGEDSEGLGEDIVAKYNSLFKNLKDVQERLGMRVANFDPRAISPIFGADGRLFSPGKTVDSGAIARAFGLFNIAAQTVMDPLPRQGQVVDVPQTLGTDNLIAQTAELAVFLRDLADNKGISQSSTIGPRADYAEMEWKSNGMNGPTLQENAAAGAMRRMPVRHCPVALVRGGAGGGGLAALSAGSPELTPPGFEYPLILMSDANGIFELAGFSGAYGQPLALACVFDDRGLISGISSQESCNPGLGNATVTLIRTRQKTLVSYGFEARFQKTLAMKGLSTSAFLPARSLLVEVGNIITLFAPPEEKTLKLFNRESVAVLNNEPTKADHQGRGILIGDPFEHPVLTQQTAHDLLAMDEYRLTLQKDNHINQESLWEIHGEAKDLHDAAARNADQWTLNRVQGTEVASAQISRGAYFPLMAVLNDLVTAVVLLLLLAVPFAFALERLLVGTPHIYRQIAWFTIFFLLAFALLFLVNPAFKLAATPIIIFLAFAIILLSLLVIFIMLRKLQVEIKKVQGLAATVHSTDVSRLGTMMAAVNMGISTMRRRPLRTLLTAITVILLTFTILTFASFGSSYGNRRRVEGPLSGAPRILVRHQLFNPIGVGHYHALDGLFEDSADVVPRYWVSPLASEAQAAATAGTSLKMFLADAQGGRVTRVDAALGIDPRDFKGGNDPRGRDIIESIEGDVNLLESGGIFLTDAVRLELGLSRGDIGKACVLLRDRQFIFAGIIKTSMAAVTGLDGANIMPVDYQANGAASVQAQPQQPRDNPFDSADVGSAQFVHFNVDQVVLISAKAAQDMNGHLRSITVYPRGDKSEDLQALADQAAKVTQLPVYVGDKATAKVERLILTSLAKASGWRDLLIPVILGGMIVFATMLGSVSDREREIYTFSSLGLAPPHVASLFFAEASVYAVVGGMGGYLLGQVVARLMGWLGGVFHFPVVTMNYSSTNAIVTILIVMGTVLVSTIYPALKASRSANPGIQRHWKIPRPEGDLYDLIFPFTVSTYDITGVASFLNEHFNNYTDTSLGAFATTSCRIFRQAGSDMLGFRAEVALAPFDLGVNHGFALLAQPSDIEGIDELRILIFRRTGAHGDWRRGTRVFINDLRKQLLIWRSLTAEVMDQYRRRTLEGWDQLSVEDVNPKTIGETP